MPDERILLVAGLPYKPTQDKEQKEQLHQRIFELFSRYGAIQQLRVGCSPLTKGYCIVVYELCDDARTAMTSLNDFQIKDRHLRVAVYEERDKNALERRKRKREVQGAYKRHVAASGVEKEED
eukprot:gene5235-3749_t